MNKKDLIDAISNVTELTKKDTAATIDAMVDVIIEEIKNGGEVNISGFGKFCVSERAERNGVNPQTGESIVIAATKSPKFKAGKNFKDALKD